MTAPETPRPRTHRRKPSARPALPATLLEEPVCAHCGKPEALCVCDAIEPINNKIELLVLQHPQEQDKTLGTARVAVTHLAKATFRIGLSWPSLSAALERDVDPKRWAVLHLGASASEDAPADRDIALLDRHGELAENQASALRGLEGIILFDGSWSQAKTLWWRNAWVLKCPRLVLRPSQASLYGKLRKEPRREGLSTLEAAAFTLSRLERKPEIEKAMLSTFRRMLQRYRAALEPQGGKPAA